VRLLALALAAGAVGATARGETVTVRDARSLAKAFDKARVDKRIRRIELASGTYELPATLVIDERLSGTASEPFVLAGAPGAHAVLTGARHLPALDWQPWQDGIWRARYQGRPFQRLWLGDRALVRARYPNVEPNKTGLVGAADATAPERYVENAFEELDAPGEWRQDRKAGWLHLKPFAPGRPPAHGFRAGTHEALLRIEGRTAGVQHVSVSNLVFQDTEPTFLKATEPLLRSDWKFYRAGAVTVENARDVRIGESEFVDLGGHAVVISGRAERVRNYTVTNAALAAKVGFINFPMNDFGVRPERLKALARQPAYPVPKGHDVEAAREAPQTLAGLLLKSIETAGEQSAAGVGPGGGVLVLAVEPGRRSSSCASRARRNHRPATYNPSYPRRTLHEEASID
jgi:hypothetical protein